MFLQKRKLYQKGYISNNYNNITDNNTIDSYNYKEEFGIYLLAWFLIFFIMGIYMISKMKSYEQTKNETDKVWTFLFMANNGTLVAAGVNILNLHNMIIDSSPFLIGVIIFIVGGSCYFKNCINNCSRECAEQYFDSNPFDYWGKIPCFIWNLIGLTDPCCRSEGYTVTVYSDGHTESNYLCHAFWNCYIKIIKRVAFF